jgi:hypothetical protein
MRGFYDGLGCVVSACLVGRQFIDSMSDIFHVPSNNGAVGL